MSDDAKRLVIEGKDQIKAMCQGIPDDEQPSRWGNTKDFYPVIQLDKDTRDEVALHVQNKLRYVFLH